MCHMVSVFFVICVCNEQWAIISDMQVPLHPLPDDCRIGMEEPDESTCGKDRMTEKLHDHDEHGASSTRVYTVSCM